MKLRQLTDSGIDRFRDYITRLKAEPKLPPPFEILEDPAASTLVDDGVDVEQRTFENRLAAAEYLHSILSDLEHTELERDTGLWTWLALFYFDQLCPAGKSGKRKVGAVVRYIPAVHDFQKYYRHLLLGPYVIYSAYESSVDDAMALLQGPLHLMTDIVEQLASRQERVTNRAVIGAATRLYIDSQSGSFKRGARGSGAGSARRLSVVLDQFDLTYDLYGMTPEELLELLPKEFNRFRK